jgi:Domain of unknown function (DUF1905)
LILTFSARLIEWRGPAPFVFAPIPDDLTPEIRFAAHEASYGWGVVPVDASIGTTSLTTSLFPRDGRYLLPVKVAVQRAEGIGVGDEVAVTMEVRGR